MITVAIYKNGWEIKGHAHPSICFQVSMWHWVASNIVLGWRHGIEVKEYASARDNSDNPNEGLSWLTFVHHDSDLDWLIEDMVVSLEKWGEEDWHDSVVVKRLDENLQKQTKPEPTVEPLNNFKACLVPTRFAKRDCPGCHQYQACVFVGKANYSKYKL